ncbi:MAG: leucyl/phenylalanyl-tRNA--protein transferase [SAR324 cluster bacterium]|nr:leucyl/phenylalanyl-tRNA--protein transferase [SAR324 cluster bacterium]
MPVYQLLEDIPLFPPQKDAEPEGLLAVGGDLSTERLLSAYQQGIFPWYEEGQPILWWSPDPRLIMEPDNLKISKSLRKVLKKQIFEVKTDTAFSRVIEECGGPRRSGQGTWITEAIKESYTKLHELGYAHSVECWFEKELVGGLYGVSIGKCFFGESMFAKKTDASKVAFVSLVEQMKIWGVEMIDCQVTSDHLLSLGAHEIPRKEFLERLKNAVQKQSPPKNWMFGTPAWVSSEPIEKP